MRLLNLALACKGIPNIKSFSYHRPTIIQLEVSKQKKIPYGFIDCYAPEYFTLSDNLAEVTVKYMSDSDHEWRYGHPLKFDISDFEKKF